ncbi:MAG: hypothetical protein RR472_00505, partial [Anaerovoracaceae bacterium]
MKKKKFARNMAFGIALLMLISTLIPMQLGVFASTTPLKPEPKAEELAPSTLGSETKVEKVDVNTFEVTERIYARAQDQGNLVLVLDTSAFMRVRVKERPEEWGAPGGKLPTLMRRMKEATVNMVDE